MNGRASTNDGMNDRASTSDGKNVPAIKKYSKWESHLKLRVGTT